MFNKDFLVGRRLMALPGCDCGTPADLTTMVNPLCLEDIGQIQRGFIVKKGNVVWDTTTPLNNLPASIASDLITEEAGWATLIALATDDKVVVTPLALAYNSTITAGSAVTTGGGDNSTPNGEIQHNGFNPADLVIQFGSMSKDQVSIMRKWGCDNLEMYFINNAGQIIARLDDSGAQDLVTGFPLINFRLGSKTNAGFGTKDFNESTAQLAFDYDEFLAWYTPTDFSALLIS